MRPAGIADGWWRSFSAAMDRLAARAEHGDELAELIELAAAPLDLGPGAVVAAAADADADAVRRERDDLDDALRWRCIVDRSLLASARRSEAFASRASATTPRRARVIVGRHPR